MTNISRSKRNQALKFGQLIEYNLRNIFLDKSYTKYGEGTILKLSLSLGQNYKVLYILFLLFCKLRNIKIDWNKAADHLHLPQINIFLKKTKRGLELVSLPHFLHDFWRKIFLLLYTYLAKFQCLVAFTSWDIGQYVYCNSLITRLWRNKFWDKFYLSNQVVFSTWLKFQDKNFNI